MNRSLKFSLLAIVVVFLETVVARLKWLGVLSWDGHQWITATSSKFLQNWLHEGAFNLGFRLIENPPSVEFGSGPASYIARGIYVSYTPGWLLIPGFISGIFHIEPTAFFLMTYNLVNHLVVALLLFDLARLFIRPTETVQWLMCVLASAAYLLLPGPMYWHECTYFADQAGIVWFVGFIWWLVRTDSQPRSLFNTVVLFLLAFMLSYTDWLGSMVVICSLVAPLIFKRQSIREVLARRWPVILAAVIAALLYAWQVQTAGGWAHLIVKIRERTGTSANGVITFGMLFTEILSHIGYFECFMLLIGGAMLVKRRTNPTPTSISNRELAFLLLIPCVLITVALRNFHYIHSFSVLKYYPFIALGFFSIGLNNVLKNKSAKTKKVVLGFVILILLVMHSQFPFKMQQPLPHLNFFTALRSNAGYDDVLLSDHLEVPDNPPQAIALGQKRIYVMKNDADVSQLAAQIKRVSPGAAPKYRLALEENSACRAQLKKAGWKEESFPDQIYLYEPPQQPLNTWPCH